MKLHKRYTNNPPLSRYISVRESHIERFSIYKQAGGDYVIDYILLIEPIHKNEINLYYFNDEATAVVIQPVGEALDELVKEFAEEGIVFNGFNIVINEAVLHPVDYRANRTKSQSKLRFSELFFKLGTKRSHNPVKHSYLPVKTHTEHPVDHAEVHNRHPEHTISNTFNLPKSNLQTLVLPKDTVYNVRLESKGSDATVHVAITAYDHGYRNLNTVTLKCRQEPDSINAFIKINSILQPLIDDIYDCGYDMCSFDIYITSATFGLNRQSSFSYADDIFWYIKDLLLRNNTIKYL